MRVRQNLAKLTLGVCERSRTIDSRLERVLGMLGEAVGHVGKR